MTLHSQFETKHLFVDGYDVMVRSNNKPHAKTVVCVHGIGVSEKYLRPFADQLADLYNVISLNLPGYGETKKPDHTLSVQELADVLGHYIEQAGIVEPILIGQSMGCQIIARLTASSDLPIQKLILISPTINARERSAPLQALRLLQDSFREPLTVNLIIILDYLKFGPLRYLKTQRSMIADQIEVSLARCSVPTLIARGKRDKIVPHGWVAQLMAVAPQATLVELDDGPHNFQYSQPKELAELCEVFIDS